MLRLTFTDAENRGWANDFAVDRPDGLGLRYTRFSRIKVSQFQLYRPHFFTFRPVCSQTFTALEPTLYFSKPAMKIPGYLSFRCPRGGERRGPLLKERGTWEAAREGRVFEERGKPGSNKNLDSGSRSHGSRPGSLAQNDGLFTCQLIILRYPLALRLA
jgi:hypothetical protein